MKINIIWGDYVVYDHGIVDISENIGEVTIDINDASGEKISELVIDCTLKNIVTLPTLSRDAQYDIEIDDGLVTAVADSPSEDPDPERDGIKISELPGTSSLQQNDLFAISRDDGSNGSYDRTLHVTLTDLIAAINPAATYTLTVNGITGGTVTPLAPENYQEGTAVTAGITMDPEYNFLSWTSDWPTLDGETNTQLSFNMPGQDVTLTPNVELIDQSVWGTEMVNVESGLGWTAWEPNDFKYSDGVQKTNDPNDTPFFYHVRTTKFTCILYIFNEYDWLEQEVVSNNYANLQLDYIDASDNVITTSGGDPMSYTGAQLQELYFHGGTGQWPSPTQKLGFNTVHGTLDDHVYLSIQFDQTYANVRARITQISSGETITSRAFIVYSDNDPIFGLDP